MNLLEKIHLEGREAVDFLCAHGAHLDLVEQHEKECARAPHGMVATVAQVREDDVSAYVAIHGEGEWLVVGFHKTGAPHEAVLIPKMIERLKNEVDKILKAKTAETFSMN